MYDYRLFCKICQCYLQTRKPVIKLDMENRYGIGNEVKKDEEYIPHYEAEGEFDVGKVFNEIYHSLRKAFWNKVVHCSQEQFLHEHNDAAQTPTQALCHRQCGRLSSFKLLGNKAKCPVHKENETFM